MQLRSVRLKRQSTIGEGGGVLYVDWAYLYQYRPRPFGLMGLHPPRMGVGDLRRTSYWAGVSLSYYGLEQSPNFHILSSPQITQTTKRSQLTKVRDPKWKLGLQADSQPTLYSALGG